MEEEAIKMERAISENKIAVNDLKRKLGIKSESDHDLKNTEKMETETSSFPDLLIHEPTSEQHTHTLILIHGRSSNARKFNHRLFTHHTRSSFQPHNFPSWRIVMPSSKRILYTRFGDVRPAWFDQYDLDDDWLRWKLMKAGLQDSVEYLKSIIRDEVEMLDGRSENVVVMGISMGCAVGLWTLLSLYGDGDGDGGGRLGGSVGASGWLPFADEIEEVLWGSEELEGEGEEKKKRSKFVRKLLGGGGKLRNNPEVLIKTPVFWGHGKDKS